jgi:hypothetical protein
LIADHPHKVEAVSLLLRELFMPAEDAEESANGASVTKKEGVQGADVNSLLT